MRRALLTLALLQALLLVMVYPIHATDGASNKPTRKIGVDDVLFAP